MIRLFVNVDHVATIREARKTDQPDPLEAALLAEDAGADGITVHLREDRRHIQDYDVERIRGRIQTPLNLEMAAVEEMVQIAERLRPEQVSLVPEKRQEITTEGGLDVAGQQKLLAGIKKRLNPLGIKVSLFVDPDPVQIDSALALKVDSIEINTGLYSELKEPEDAALQVKKIAQSARRASEGGLKVFAGHGLSVQNVRAIAQVPAIEELNIGHSLVARSVFIGLGNAIREMKQILETIDKFG